MEPAGDVASSLRAEQRPATDAGGPYAGPAADQTAHTATTCSRTRRTPSTAARPSCSAPGQRPSPLRITAHRAFSPPRQHRHHDLVDCHRTRPRSASGTGHPPNRSAPDRCSHGTFCGATDLIDQHSAAVEQPVISPDSRITACSHLAAPEPTRSGLHAVSAGRPWSTTSVPARNNRPSPRSHALLTGRAGEMPGHSSADLM